MTSLSLICIVMNTKSESLIQASFSTGHAVGLVETSRRECSLDTELGRLPSLKRVKSVTMPGRFEYLPGIFIDIFLLIVSTYREKVIK